MDFAKLRESMVEEQLVLRGISDPRVLAAFRKVPREEFVPAHARPSAYNDAPLSIGRDQTISQPYTVAFMTALLDPQPTDRVLEVGTGSGYQAAILAELVKEVFTIECLPELSGEAGRVLERLGYKNVAVLVGDGSRGLAEEAPFDKIIVTAAAVRVPEALLAQLKDGGRLVAPVGGKFVQQMVRVTRVGEGFTREFFGAFTFVPLVGRELA